MVAKIRIYARPQSINQARRPEFYKYIDRLLFHSVYYGNFLNLLY